MATTNGVVENGSGSTVALGRYLWERIHQVGVNHVFGVPGDFNLTCKSMFLIEPIFCNTMLTAFNRQCSITSITSMDWNGLAIRTNLTLLMPPMDTQGSAMVLDVLLLPTELASYLL